MDEKFIITPSAPVLITPAIPATQEAPAAALPAPTVEAPVAKAVASKPTRAAVKPRVTAKKVETPVAPAAATDTPPVATKAAVKPRAAATKPATAAAKVAPAATKLTPAAEKAAKAATSAATKPVAVFKPKVMSLVAGLVVKIEDKRLNKALGYHTKTTGTLEKKAEGYALTTLGEQAWTFQRVAKSPALFQEVANFVKRGGPIPAIWKNQPALKVGEVTLPNPIYWGSFSTAEMRLAFAAIWAS
jgi:hypothetical protein